MLEGTITLFLHVSKASEIVNALNAVWGLHQCIIMGKIVKRKFSPICLHTLVFYVLFLLCCCSPVPVYFQSDLTFMIDSNGDMLFSIVARGTQTLEFKWFLDDELVEAESSSSTIISEIGSEATVRSELNLERLPPSPTSLQVLVSNKDSFTMEIHTVNRTALLVSHNQPAPAIITQSPEPPTSGNIDPGEKERGGRERV